MRGNVSDKARFEHIFECILEIETALENETFESFYKNHILRIAIVKWLEIIGEAANHITNDTKSQFPNVKWAMMSGLRNIVVHEYFGIVYEVIWNTATESIKKLKNEIEGIITSIN